MTNPFAGMRAGRWLPVIALVMTGAVATPANAAPTPEVSCSDTAVSDAAASAMAKACSREVAVESSRSEYAQIVARPDGGMQFESAVLPQRAKQNDGRWADIDLTLQQGKDGWRPRVSIANVAFSAGGDAPMATVARNGKKFTMSLLVSACASGQKCGQSGKLPAPIVSGDSATYVGVLRDVDLVVRATRTGFTHVLVVKTPAAAALVRTVKFGLGGDVKVSRSADGSLRAVAGSTVVASAKPAVMWDSNTVGDRSSVRGSGDSARVRPIRTEVAGNSLVLHPDAALLGAPVSAYPLYVDPDWEYGSGGGQKWAYATSNNAGNTDYSVARVGKDPESSTVYRSFFEFPTTSNGISLGGKHIRAAYVHMRLTHSSSCSYQYNYMYLTPVINATMKASWSSMALSAFLAEQQGRANTSGCGADQGDMDMNFFGATTGQVQTAAAGGWSSITVGFAARDTGGGGETTGTRWMKYYPEHAALVVEYDSIPGQPTGLQVAGVDCPSGTITVGTLTPNLSAVYPDADSSQTLTGAYEWIEVPGGGIGTVNDAYPSRLSPGLSASASANGRAWTSSLPTLTKGKVYAYRLRTTDPAPYNQVSLWSGWCQFEVDTSVPQVSVNIVSAPSGPGKPGVFKISSSSGDVTKFKYGWGAATTEVAASGSPKSATVTLTAPKFGQNILYVSAVDATLNEGFGSAGFPVGRPSPAVARWGLETYPGTDATAALADQQPALAGNTPVTASNVTWAAGERMVSGSTPVFNGTNSNMATTTKIVDSTKSFAVAAWVKLTGTDLANRQYAIATQSHGSDDTMFFLHTCRSGQWCAQTRRATPGAADTYPGAFSNTGIKTGVWTHVAAAYDADEHTIVLYVDGVRQNATATGITMSADSGPFRIGQASWGNFFQGDIADVQLFDRVLVGHDFTGMLASDPESGGFNEPGILAPIQVGAWDFNAAVPCYTADLRDTCEAPDATGWNRWLSLSRGSAIGAGRSTSDSGLWLDSAYFPEDGNTETGTLEYGKSALKTAITEPDENGLEYTNWQNHAVLRTDQSFTVSAWASLSQLPNGSKTVLAQDGSIVSGFFLGAVLDSASGQYKWTFNMHDADALVGARYAKATNPITSADLGRWTQLTAVYDAQRMELRLYVNGVKQTSGTRPASVTPWQAPGSFTVGRGWYNNAQVNHFPGAIDDVQAHQGAMTDTAALQAYQQIGQSQPYLSIVNPVTGRCVAANSTSEGADLALRGCNGMGHQRFALQSYSSIVNPVTGRCMAANSTSEGAGLELLGCNGMTYQQLELRPDGSIVNPATGRCVAANSTSEGADLALWGCNGMGHQLFSVRPDGSIVNPATGRCVAANSTSEGAGLELRGCNGMGHQIFSAQPDGSIVNPATGRCVAANSTSEGADLALWGCNGMGHQIFSGLV